MNLFRGGCHQCNVIPVLLEKEECSAVAVLSAKTMCHGRGVEVSP